MASITRTPHIRGLHVECLSYKVKGSCSTRVYGVERGEQTNTKSLFNIVEFNSLKMFLFNIVEFNSFKLFVLFVEWCQNDAEGCPLRVRYFISVQRADKSYCHIVDHS